MKLLIYEFYASGTGSDQEDLKKSGFIMLDAVLKDFIRIPGLEILTMLDSTLEEDISTASYLQKLHIRWTDRDKDILIQFQENLSACDWVLIIAPESDRQFAKLTAMAENCGKKVLGSSGQTLEFTSNKADVINLFKNKGIRVPRSEMIIITKSGKDEVNVKDVEAKIIEKFPFPLVIKPEYGAGGNGVRLVENYSQLEMVVKDHWCRGGVAMLLQEYIVGEAVSVSCLVLNSQVLPISLNKQIINPQDELVFQGITIPYQHVQEEEIMKTVVYVCQTIDGLRGFVGVDLVVSAEGPIFMEINARITMAYVALREIVPRNLAEDLLAIFLEEKIPEKLELTGTYTYRL